LYGGENAYLLDDYLTALAKAGIHIRTVLNPFQSDINLFPETRDWVKRRIARQLGLSAIYVPDWY